MCTARFLPVSPSMHCVGGCLVPGGVCLVPGGSCLGGCLVPGGLPLVGGGLGVGVYHNMQWGRPPPVDRIPYTHF